MPFYDIEFYVHTVEVYRIEADNLEEATRRANDNDTTPADHAWGGEGSVYQQDLSDCLSVETGDITEVAALDPLEVSTR